MFQRFKYAVPCCSPAAFVLMLALIVPFGNVQAQMSEAVRTFDEGNQLFVAGNYRNALVAYEQALSNGYASGPLYYNMGNAYYRLDELGQAIRYYEKARQLTPDSPELLHNLDIARNRTTDQFSQLPTPFWVVGWQKVTNIIGAGGFFFIGVFFYLIAAALIGYRIWWGMRNAWHRRALTVSAFAGAFFLLIAFTASLSSETDRRAVVLPEEVILRQEPNTEAEEETDIHEGLVVGILRKQAPWVELQLPNGVTGWVQEQTLGEI